jgi:hypothetical protein
MTEWPGPNDWLLRADALTLIRFALNCPEEEAETYLLDFACDDPSFEWKHRRRFIITPGRPPPQGKKRISPPIEAIHLAIQTRFWKRVRKGDARILVKGNSATYVSAIFLALTHAEVRYKLKPERNRVEQNATLVHPDWRIEIHLSVIRFLAAPLITALRADGGLVDEAIKHLRSVGRLPHSAVNETEPEGNVGEKTWLADELKNHPPGDLRKAAWARAAANRSGRKVSAIQTMLSKYHELWLDAGGRDTPSTMQRRRPHRRRSRSH